MGVPECIGKVGDDDSEYDVWSWGFNGGTVFVDTKILVWPCEWGPMREQDIIIRDKEVKELRSQGIWWMIDVDIEWSPQEKWH